VGQVHSLQAGLAEKALFLTIYLAEAHAQDQWPLGRHVQVLQHKTVEDRLAIANRYVETTGYQIHLVADDITNPFLKAYWAHPERFYVIVDGKLGLKGQPTDDGWYVFSDITNFIAQLGNQ